MKEQRARVCDLFCGAGGLSLGFHAAGASISTMIDHDAIAARTAERNFNVILGENTRILGGPEHGDLEKLTLSNLHSTDDIDVLLGGPPCQAFSVVGRAKLIHLQGSFSDDPRNHLYRRFLDALQAWKPRAFVMENVPGMLNVRGVNLAEGIAAELESCGYRAGYEVLNAVRFGVPQYRERIFFVGFREDLGMEPSLPVATHSARIGRTMDIPPGYGKSKLDQTPLLPGMEEKNLRIRTLISPDALAPVTVAEAIDDLPEIIDHLDGSLRRGQRDFRSAMTYPGTPHSGFSRLMRTKWPLLGDRPDIMDHCIRRTPRDYETFRRMAHGDRYPQAVRIARKRFEEHLAGLGKEAPVAETNEYKEMEKKFLPPYGRKDGHKNHPDRWRKLYPGEPSWTLPAHLSKDSYSHIHHDSVQARMISVREAARLQSFPDAFQFEGNLGDCFRQIGNAVPPLMAWHIGATILEALGYEPRSVPATQEKVT